MMHPTTAHPLPDLQAELMEINALITRETRRAREKKAAARQYAARLAIERFREHARLERDVADYWFDP